MAKILMVIAQKKFRDEELTIPLEAFRKEGHQVDIASRKAGKCTGMLGGTAVAELSIKNLNTDSYDAVVFVGGSGSSVYFDDTHAIGIAQQMYDGGKIVAAICIAPVILANAGILKSREATVFSSESGTIRRKGAKYTGGGVAVDGKIITGDSPGSAGAFAEKVCEALKNR